MGLDISTIKNLHNMKKTFFTTLFSLILTINIAQAFDLQKAVNTVGQVANNPKSPAAKSVNSAIKDPLARLEKQATQRIDQVMSKVENKVDQATSKVEERIEKYEKKIEQLEKTTDKMIDTFNSFDAKKLDQIANLAKNIGIAIAGFFALMVVLLILVFIQLIRVNKRLILLKK